MIFYEMLRIKRGLLSCRDAFKEAHRECDGVRLPKARLREGGDPSQIRFNRRRWLPQDQAYWEPFGISQQQLQAAGVHPVAEYELRTGERVLQRRIHKLCYAYTGFSEMRVKLYFPERKGRYRFLSTCKADDVGYVPGNSTMKRVIISKSYKDAEREPRGQRAVQINDAVVVG